MYLLLQRPEQAMREVREYSDRVYWSPLTTYVSQSADSHSQTDAKHNCAQCSKDEGALDEARYDNVHGNGDEGIVCLANRIANSKGCAGAVNLRLTTANVG